MGVCSPRLKTPTHIYGFLSLKKQLIWQFFKIFTNRNPFLKVSPCLINSWFYEFFVIFVKWEPLLRIFLTKMETTSKDFWWKSNPYGRHIPLCCNMQVPPIQHPHGNVWKGKKKMLLLHLHIAPLYTALYIHLSQFSYQIAPLCIDTLLRDPKLKQITIKPFSLL